MKMNDHDNLRHYRFAREQSREMQAAAWKETRPWWVKGLRVLGAVASVVGVITVFWLITVVLFLI